MWNDALKREIPVGWNVDNLYFIADFINGLACQKHRPTDENHKLPVIKITEMHDGFTSNTEFAKDDVPSKYIINNGDILFSWSATLETQIWNKGKGVLNQHIFKVEPKNISKYYVYEQLSSYIGNFVKMAEARKTTMGHITTDHLKQSLIPIPPKHLLDSFDGKVSPLFEQMTNLHLENNKLISLRDYLLPLLMNGQITIE